MMISSVNDDYSYSYLKKVEEQQNKYVSTVDETDDVSKTASSTTVGLSNGSYDEYIPSSNQPENSAGIYKVKQDENGKMKIIFDSANSTEKSSEQSNADAAVSAASNAASSAAPRAIGGQISSEGSDSTEESASTDSTDAIDLEIKKLEKEKDQIEQELKSNRNDEDKHKELEQQLEEVEAELNILNATSADS